MPDWIVEALKVSPVAVSILAGLYLLARSFDGVVKILGNHVVHSLDKISDKLDDLPEKIAKELNRTRL